MQGSIESLDTQLHAQDRVGGLTLLHSEQPNLYGVLAVLSAIGLNTLSE